MEGGNNMAKDNTQEKLDVLEGIIDQDAKTYSFEKTISVLGKKKKGSFTAKYMGITARLRLGTIRAKLLDGAPTQSVDPLTDDIAYMIAYLSVTLIKTPTWWNYDELDDLEDLKAVFDEVSNFMRNFREKNAKDSNVGDSGATSSKTNMESVQRTPITAE